jgi:hypothetical protein
VYAFAPPSPVVECYPPGVTRQFLDDRVCACGHATNLHDTHGCAAFLGAFYATAERKTYCTCHVPRDNAGADRAVELLSALSAVPERPSA